MSDALNAVDATHSLDIQKVFVEARTFYRFQDRPVADDLLKTIYNIVRMGPTSNNGCPMRIVFAKSAGAKARLVLGVKPKNVEKVLNAPVTAIFGFDMAFYEHFNKLAPHAVANAGNYVKDSDLRFRAAFRNGTLQAAYFLMVTRAFGLQCGPMSGFYHDIVDQEFFAGSEIKSNFIMTIGYGDPEGVRPRGYRFGFDEVCSII